LIAWFTVVVLVILTAIIIVTSLLPVPQVL
jgi:hypothetical protein